MTQRQQTDVNHRNGVEHELTTILTYSGYVLLAFELIKGMIIRPIKSFYAHTTFEGGPFHSYEKDALTRSKNEFEACLLYLKDFMEAINEEDMKVIHALREHRNDLAHNLPNRLDMGQIDRNSDLLKQAKEVIFKLSNYRTYIEIGHEPELRGVDWNSVKGHEYLIIEKIIDNVDILKQH
jgi:hypothetical protein